MKTVIFAILLFSVCAFAQDRGMEIRPGTAADGHARIALVIGNGLYQSSPLRNPATDAHDMAQALRAVGFEVVCKTDLRQNEMKQAIRVFGQSLQSGSVGLFYYAGHAVQVDGRNYLIPVGAEISQEHEVEYEAVDVGFLLSQIQDAHNQLNIVILDACRNNPFSRRFRSMNAGLASINAPSGTLIAYATAPGSVASDGDGRNGLYTQELLKAMRQPALKIEDVFKLVRSGVQSLTNGVQVPWESSSLVGDFYFLLGGVEPKGLPTKGADGHSAGQASPAEPSSKSSPLGSNGYRSPLASTAAAVFVKEGDSAAKQKRWVAAETEYRQAVELAPSDARLRVKLGDVLSQQQKWAEAETQYAVAVRLEPLNKSYQDRMTTSRNRNQ